MKGVRIIVAGRVQGVWFRAHTQQEAKGLGVAGFVRNLSDGTVEVVAEGASDAVDALVEWCRQGSPLAAVDDVRVEELPEAGGFERFDIRH